MSSCYKVIVLYNAAEGMVTPKHLIMPTRICVLLIERWVDIGIGVGVDVGVGIEIGIGIDIDIDTDVDIGTDIDTDSRQ